MNIVCGVYPEHGYQPNKKFWILIIFGDQSSNVFNIIQKLISSKQKNFECQRAKQSNLVEIQRQTCNFLKLEKMCSLRKQCANLEFPPFSIVLSINIQNSVQAFFSQPPASLERLKRFVHFRNPNFFPLETHYILIDFF